MTIPSQSNRLSISPSQAGRPESTPASQPAAAEVSSSQSDSGGETLQTTNLALLREAVSYPPELRPLEMARAIVWAKDPNYPPLDKLNNIASMFLAEAIRNL
jgi:hypothetical protein